VSKLYVRSHELQKHDISPLGTSVSVLKIVWRNSAKGAAELLG